MEEGESNPQNLPKGEREIGSETTAVDPAVISQWKLMLILACGGLITNLCIGALMLKQNSNFIVQEQQKSDAVAKNRKFLEEVNLPMDQLVRELVSLNPPGIREIFAKYGLSGPLSMLPPESTTAVKSAPPKVNSPHSQPPTPKPK